METLGDLVARERRSDDPALSVPGSRGYDYHRFCTTAWKTGNFLRHLGVREGVTVGVVTAPTAHALLSLFGAGLLGARVRFDPPTELDARVLLAPGDRVAEYDLPPGGGRVAYGEESDDPTVRGFEREVWSENPSFPPLDVDPDAALLTDGEREYSHRATFEAARRVVDEADLAEGTRVAVRAPLSDPRTVAAGVVAPLLAGGEIALPDADAAGASVVVGDASSPTDAGVLPLDRVPLEPGT